MRIAIARRAHLRDFVLALGVVAALAYWIIPYSAAKELVIYDGLVLLATVASVLGCRRAPAGQRLGWACVSVSLALFLVGELTWWALSALGREPFPSIADAAFLLGYVPLAVAAAALATTWDRAPDQSAWLDAAILSAVAGLVIFDVLMEPYVHDPTSGALSKLVTIAYPLADVLVLGFVLRLGLSRQGLNRSTTQFTIGVGLMLAADTGFGWQSLHGTFTSGSWLDAVWLVSYLMIGFAALYTPPVARVREIPEQPGVDRRRLALILVLVTVPQAVLMGELLGRGLLALDTLFVATCTSLAVIGLVCIRLWSLQGQARRMEEQRGAERLSALIHHSADAIFLLDDEGQISFCKPRGRDARKQAGRGVARHVAPRRVRRREPTGDRESAAQPDGNADRRHDTPRRSSYGLRRA